jgi:DNA-binding beta-propeller fold protein YncE
MTTNGSKSLRIVPAFVGMALIGSLVVASGPGDRSVNGTIWVANRGAHSIRGFDAGTGVLVNTIAMAANSQPGDLAYAKGKLYVAEEFGAAPAIAILDEETGVTIKRIFLPLNPDGSSPRPHHVHSSPSGNLVAVGLYGTDTVAVVDTHDDALLGPWDTNTLTTNGRVHAGVFSQDDHTLYLTSDASNEVFAIDPRSGEVFWRMIVPGAHELVLTHDDKIAYVSRRTANRLAVINLQDQTFKDVLALGLPDSLQLSSNEKLLTVGLRTMPAQVAVVDTKTLGDQPVPCQDPAVQCQIVDLAPGESTTLAGHQWTSPSGRYTFAAFEGGPNPGVSVIDHFAGNRVVQRLNYPGRPHGVDHAHP